MVFRKCTVCCVGSRHCAHQKEGNEEKDGEVSVRELLEVVEEKESLVLMVVSVSVSVSAYV